MVGDHPVAGAVLALGGNARGVLRGRDQPAEQVDVVIVVLALQERRDAFEPHAGVDRRPRQIDPLLGGNLLELHENEIPDLDKAVAILFGRSRRSAPDMVAVIVEDLRAGTARSGVAHRPEIVIGRDPDDPVFGNAGDLAPQIKGIVVGVVDRDQQPVLVDGEILGQEVPGKLDGAFLEIVAEGEIAEHLEEGVVTCGVADIVEVVVLAAGAHAFLRCRRRRIGPVFETGEDVLELHHARIGEHQRRVIARHKRARRHDLVSVLLEIVEKRRPDFVHATHDQPFV